MEDRPAYKNLGKEIADIEWKHLKSTKNEQRYQTEEELTIYRNHLEELVAERTAELEKVNKELQHEIAERKQAEDELFWVGKAIESTSETIKITGPDGRHFYHNNAFTKLFGYEQDELDLAGGSRVLFADQDVHRSITEAVEKRGSWSGEIELVKKNGQKFPGRIRVDTVKEEGGNVIGYVGICSDISERRGAEDALRQSEERFRALVETTSDWVWETDVWGRITYASSKIIKLFGYTPEEIKGKTVYDLMPEKEGKLVADIFEKNAKLSEPVKILENMNLHKDGHKMLMELSAVPIFDSEERLVGWRGLARDITEQKQAENALRKSEQRLTNVRRAVNEGIWEWDIRENKVVYSSDRFLEIMGFENKETVSFEDWSGRLHPDYKDRVLGKLLKTLKGDSVYDVEYEYRNNEGEYKWLSTTATLVNKDKEDMHLVGSVRDITERKLAEKEKQALQAQLQQAQKMEALGTLAGGIAHDFNNLLQSIIVNTELGLYELEEKGNATKRLKQILKASQRAKELVKQIVSFSRKSEKEQIPLRLTPLVKESLKLLRSTLPVTIEVRQNLRAEKDTIMADPTQMNQILMNLCTNAAHAMQEKGGVLEVSMVDMELDNDALDFDADLKPGKYIVLTVSDTGHGMDNTVMERIFDPFFTTKKPGQGTGMGLSVVHGIVKGSKGGIIVHSEPGKGSSFRVIFPQIEEHIIPGIDSPAPLTGWGEKILLIDDEKMIIDALGPALESLGYRVVAITNGDEALNRFQMEPEQFDLVITDQTMPNITGAELAKRLLAIRPDIPIIICTGFSDLITPEEARTIGIREFLVKPIITQEISSAIRRVLENGG